MQTDDMAAREKALIARAQAGDEKALAELFRANDSRVRRLVRRMGVNDADLDDVVQETRIRVWRALKSFRGECKFSTWQCRIAKNIVKTARATAALRPYGHYATGLDVEEWLLESLPALTDTPEQALSARQNDDRVRAELAGLPASMREALELRLFEGLSYEEIAKRQRCPIGTVRSRLSRAVGMLERKLGLKLRA